MPVIQTMMRLSAAENRPKAVQDRAKSVNNDALETEQEKNGDEKEVQEMYLDTDQIVPPVAPVDVSPVKGILSSTPFFFLTLRDTTLYESTPASARFVH